jgi:hypothetical protein
MPIECRGYRRRDESGVRAVVDPAALEGELDSAVRRLWPVALERADPGPDAGTIAIDAGHPPFIDHRILLDVADHAERHDRTRLSIPARLLQLFDLEHL